MAEPQAITSAREYETIYVLRPDVAREGQERIAARVTEVVARENGKLTTLENWGRRQLAYTVSKFRRGVYVYVRYLGGGALVNEVERNDLGQLAQVPHSEHARSMTDDRIGHGSPCGGTRVLADPGTSTRAAPMTPAETPPLAPMARLLTERHCL